MKYSHIINSMIGDKSNRRIPSLLVALSGHLKSNKERNKVKKLLNRFIFNFQSIFFFIRKFYDPQIVSRPAHQYVV